MIQADLFHMGVLLTPTDDQPRFAQIFFYDIEEARAIRTARHFDLDLGVLRHLTKMLHTLNFYIELYKTAIETLKDNIPTDDNLQIVLNPQMQLVIKAGVDCHCKNLFTGNKVAAIIIVEYDNLCEQNILFTKLVNGVN